MYSVQLFQGENYPENTSLLCQGRCTYHYLADLFFTGLDMTKHRMLILV